VKERTVRVRSVRTLSLRMSRLVRRRTCT
jgi:hypothetical protein